jgi:hypothetical protein
MLPSSGYTMEISVSSAVVYNNPRDYKIQTIGIEITIIENTSYLINIW